MGYECKGCGAYYESQLKGRCHVHLEHGIAWRKTSKWLKWRENLAKRPSPNHKKSRKPFKVRLIGIFAYKGYLKDLPIFGTLKLDQSGKTRRGD